MAEMDLDTIKAESADHFGSLSHACRKTVVKDDAYRHLDAVSASHSWLIARVDELERQRADEVWKHAACLTIAQGYGGSAVTENESAAMIAVRVLRDDRDRMAAVLAGIKRECMDTCSRELVEGTSCSCGHAALRALDAMQRGDRRG